MNYIFTLSAKYLDALDSELKRLEKKAERLGVPPAQMTVLEVRTDKKGAALARVEIVSEPLRLSGWTFAASLDPKGEGAQGLQAAVIREAGRGLLSEADLLALKERGPVCDHCHTRRERREVFAVKHDDGTLNVVGRTCLKDFMGHKNAEDWAHYFSLLDHLVQRYSDADEERLGRAAAVYPTEDLLSAAACVVRGRGRFTAKTHFIPNVDGEWWTTAEAACELLNPHSAELFKVQRTPRGREYGPFLTGGITDEDRAHAGEVLAWARGLSEAQRSEGTYLHNVYTVLHSPFVREKHVGIAVSALSAYAKAQEQRGQAQEAEPEPAPVSEHIYPLKHRVREMPFTVQKAIEINGYYPLHLYIVRDFAGNVFKVTSSRRLSLTNERGRSEELKEGDTGTLTGTVEELSEYNGVKQTVLKRVVLH